MAHSICDQKICIITNGYGLVRMNSSIYHVNLFWLLFLYRERKRALKKWASIGRVRENWESERKRETWDSERVSTVYRRERREYERKRERKGVKKWLKIQNLPYICRIEKKRANTNFRFIWCHFRSKKRVTYYIRLYIQYYTDIMHIFIYIIILYYA